MRRPSPQIAVAQNREAYSSRPSHERLHHTTESLFANDLGRVDRQDVPLRWITVPTRWQVVTGRVRSARKHSRRVSLSHPPRQFRTGDLRNSISQPASPAPLKPHGCEIRDRGVFSCADKETTAIPSQYRESPQQVATCPPTSVNGELDPKRHGAPAPRSRFGPPNPETLGFRPETTRPGYDLVRSAIAVSDLRRKVRKK